VFNFWGKNRGTDNEIPEVLLTKYYFSPIAVILLLTTNLLQNEVVDWW
jgi:hypothetical protein